MNKIIATSLVLLALCCICMSASGKSGTVPEPCKEAVHRSAGYRGSVSLTDHVVVWVGLETSHGYMFNAHHYLGAGAGIFMVPSTPFPTVAHFFVDYNAYILKRNSTPTAGVKAGYAMSIGEVGHKPLEGMGDLSAFELEPNIGWSWAFENELGLRLSIGATIMIARQWQTAVMPKLSVAFEF